MNFKFDKVKAQEELQGSAFSGKICFDDTMRRLYATDASEYQELPFGVVFPKEESDIRLLILWANKHRVSLIPRTAGTSLAGQCVGSGLVVDLSLHFTRILEINKDLKKARVHPGVIRNELNMALAEKGLFFGPETSTANRAMIGGMVGNNSCGSNSIIYGSTREHLLRIRGFLSDGSEVTFESIDKEAFEKKCLGDSLEAQVYRMAARLLGSAENRNQITKNFPEPSIPRRNTGYAIDLLMDSQALDEASEKPFNFCRVIAGSEGTLFFAVEIELNCSPLPPSCQAVICGHFRDVNEALRANLIALEHLPSASELIDKHILDCSKKNLEQARNRDFIVGDPGAILVIELRRDTQDELESAIAKMTASLEAKGLGYAYPVLHGEASSRIWQLRRAGQAVMSNVEGDEKPREVIEDTAVRVQDLPDFIAEISQNMKSYGISCVYYGHAATGELHLRPIFSLRTPEGHALFRRIGEETAALVKKYRGSLSGEHGDGRLRGEFIRSMVGDQCYEMMREFKQTFDPKGIFNPGKIIDAPRMDENLRHEPGHVSASWSTVFDWSSTGGMLAAAEKCNGAGDCRKTHLSGGTMCPSYMATHKEEDSTRGRANMLRQLMTESGQKAMQSKALYDVLDLCMSCKGCKSECASNVDMGKMKAEFLQGYYETHGAPLRSVLISRFASISQLTSIFPWAWNFVFSKPSLRKIANKLTGFHPDRTIPLLPDQTLVQWFKGHVPHPQAGTRGQVYLFADEFTNYQDAQVGKHTVELLEKLGYQVLLPDQLESGRAALSKGFLKNARHLAEGNVRRLHPVVSAEHPLIGIEPSAILSFRDEYPELLRGDLQQQAKELSANCLLLEEFLVREHDAGRLPKTAFQENKQTIRLHGHCHQKALIGMLPTIRALELVSGHDVRLIPSGCCGMAGSFGYEKEHYDISQKIGNLVLFPTIRSQSKDTILCAPGTSCRHQIHDGTGRTALHPAEILNRAVR